MKLAQTLLAGAVLSMAAMSAQAAITQAPTNLGVIGSVAKSTFVDVPEIGSFTHLFNFSVAESSLLQGNSVSANVKNRRGEVTGWIADGKVELLQGSTSLGSFSFDQSTFVFTNVLAANQQYTFKVTGFTSGPGLDYGMPGYTLTTAANVAPVPEPETYALMGLGLAGLLAARRRKAKQAA